MVIRDDQVMGDLVGVTVEKVLISIGMPTYEKVADMLQGRFATFADCYRNPELLNTILKRVYGNAHVAIVEKIKEELDDMSENDQVVVFIRALSK